MALQQFTNNATSTLASGITNTATSLSVASGDGALFPSLSGSEWFICTLIKNADPTTREIIKITAVSTDTFTIVRGQEGTTALAWAAGDLIELRTTAGGLLNMAQKDDISNLSTIVIDTFGNVYFSYNATYSGGTWTYTTTGYATQLSYNTTGQTIFRHAVSGTAGAAITWVQGPYIDATGALKSYKGVATGYTRISPTECLNNTRPPSSLVGLSTTLTEFSAPTTDSGGGTITPTGIILDLQGGASTNAVGINIYSDSGGSTLIWQEHTTVAGNIGPTITLPYANVWINVDSGFSGFAGIAGYRD